MITSTHKIGRMMATEERNERERERGGERKKKREGERGREKERKWERERESGRERKEREGERERGRERKRERGRERKRERERGESERKKRGEREGERILIIGGGCHTSQSNTQSHTVIISCHTKYYTSHTSHASLLLMPHPHILFKHQLHHHVTS